MAEALVASTPTLEIANAALRAAVESRLAKKNADVVDDAQPAKADPAALAESAATHGQPLRPGSLEFLGVLDEIKELHLRKTLDYGDPSDALSNIRNGAALIGVEPWRACLIRVADKLQRLKSFCRRGVVEFDGIDDTFKDIAAYCVIALVLYREGMRDERRLDSATDQR